MTSEQRKTYFQFAVASSIVLFGFDGEKLKILSTPQKEEPFQNALTLPSKYIKVDENLDISVAKAVKQWTNQESTYIEQLKAFTKVFRNPTGRVINVAYYALVKLEEEIITQTADFSGVWYDYNDIPELAFDHNEIIDYAKERLKRRVKRRPIGFYLLPEKFTILQLQNLYEQALNKKLDKRNFRKKIFKSELILETDEEDTTSKKPAKLYRFDESNYEKLTLKGYDFLF